MTENTTVNASRPALEDQLRVPFWIVLAGVGAGAIWALAGVGVGAWVRGRRSHPGHHRRACR